MFFDYKQQVKNPISTISKIIFIFKFINILLTLTHITRNETQKCSWKVERHQVLIPKQYILANLPVPHSFVIRLLLVSMPDHQLNSSSSTYSCWRIFIKCAKKIFSINRNWFSFNGFQWEMMSFYGVDGELLE